MPFNTGDQVVWNDKFDDPDGTVTMMLETLREELGEGPFKIVKVEDIPARLLSCGHFPEDPEHVFCETSDYYDEQIMRDANGHPQRVYIDAEPSQDYSGCYFVLANQLSKLDTALLDEIDRQAFFDSDLLDD
jgi:recombinational DNA repair protein RecR